MLSHEIVEALNNPFVNAVVQDITPWWLGPNGFCGFFLETGDPLQAPLNSSHHVTMNGMTYHLQNHALVPWFKRESPRARCTAHIRTRTKTSSPRCHLHKGSIASSRHEA